MSPLRFGRIVTVFLVEIGVALFLVSLSFFVRQSRYMCLLIPYPNGYSVWLFYHCVELKVWNVDCSFRQLSLFSIIYISRF